MYLEIKKVQSIQRSITFSILKTRGIFGVLCLTKCGRKRHHLIKKKNHIVVNPTYVVIRKIIYILLIVSLYYIIQKNMINH